MLELAVQIEIWLAVAAGIFCVALSVAKRLPSLVSLGALALVELALIAQLIWSIVLVTGGAGAKGDTVEFFGYIITALFVPPAAALWALVERSRWSTTVLGVAGLTVAVMLVRMWQIWSGTTF
ncbi:MAG: hypothetical protein RLZZ304_1060 [Actinomycetota bacterium]|jgi:hypothetical protein